MSDTVRESWMPITFEAEWEPIRDLIKNGTVRFYKGRRPRNADVINLAGNQLLIEYHLGSDGLLLDNETGTTALDVKVRDTDLESQAEWLRMLTEDGRTILDMAIGYRAI